MSGSSPPTLHSSERKEASLLVNTKCSFLKIYHHIFSYLIDRLFDFGLLGFSTGEDKVGTKSPYELKLFPQTICLCLDCLI